VNSLRWLSLFALALSVVPSFAWADDPPTGGPPPPPSAAEKVQRRVEDGLLKPLAERESKASPFSRARPMPRERRVRVTDTTATLDKAGRPFLSFAIDVRFRGFDDAEWHENDVVGCAYTKTGEIFVKRGDAYRPASFLLGKKADPVTGVCEAAPAAATATAT
jgi:hypothetical protein